MLVVVFELQNLLTFPVPGQHWPHRVGVLTTATCWLATAPVLFIYILLCLRLHNHIFSNKLSRTHKHLRGKKYVK